MTREQHDRYLAAARQLRELHPDHAATFDARSATEIGTPANDWSRDYTALSAVASSYATGDRPRKSNMRRAENVLARLEESPR
jgi:hypothetical protein